MSKSTPSQPEVKTDQLITVSKDRKAITTSLNVAEFFGKRHDHVVRDIEELAKRGLPNFGETLYVHPQNNQKYKMYEMDRTGFTLLAMGFTGEKALDFKIRYIQAFDAMESALMVQKDSARLESDILEGMKQICDYIMKSEPTVLSLIRDNGFPARKVRGVWECRKSSIDAWRDLAHGKPYVFDKSVDMSLAVFSGTFAPDVMSTYPVLYKIVRGLNELAGNVLPSLEDMADYVAQLLNAEILAEKGPSALKGLAVKSASYHVEKQEPAPAIPVQVPIIPSDHVGFLIEHYKSMIAGYREEIAGYRHELAFYRGLHKGIEMTDYTRLTDKARRCLSNLTPSYVGLDEETIVELALCMATGNTKGKRMAS